MPINFETKIITYKWTPFNKDSGVGNKLPFYFKCSVCGTITEIVENDPSKTYDCSNPKCGYKLKFVI